jgi:hypothetical protein
VLHDVVIDEAAQWKHEHLYGSFPTPDPQDERNAGPNYWAIYGLELDGSIRPGSVLAEGHLDRAFLAEMREAGDRPREPAPRDRGLHTSPCERLQPDDPVPSLHQLRDVLRDTGGPLYGWPHRVAASWRPGGSSRPTGCYGPSPYLDART